MTRILTLIAALGLALAPLTSALAASSGAAPSADMQAKFEQDAEKSCNYDLDHDRFGSYGTMEECIADKSAKLERSYHAQSSTVQAAAQPH